jgi:hypothetical protein
MRCDAAARPRTLADGAVLLALAALIVFYGAVAFMILSPRMDEEYRRTFVTREFGAYPTSKVFDGRNGLDYAPGTRADLSKSKQRLHLNRFEWPWRGPPGARMRGWSGRIFVHVRDDLRRPDRPHRLTLGAVCAFPAGIAGIFEVRVNGTPVGGFRCDGRADPMTFSAEIPPGLIGSLKYDEITVERTPEGWQDRLATRLGLRFAAFFLSWFEISTL